MNQAELLGANSKRHFKSEPRWDAPRPLTIQAFGRRLSKGPPRKTLNPKSPAKPAAVKIYPFNPRGRITITPFRSPAGVPTPSTATCELHPGRHPQILTR